MSSRTAWEPGVFGIFRPVLLLPEGISEKLSQSELKAVIAHELCHVRHRDNLVAAIHMFLETIFWFHPLVWWIGKRMVEERERACDQEVLRLGNEPRIYAQGILKVCKSYLSSPLECASGVTGSPLERRIEAIVTNQPSRDLDIRGKILLIAAGIVALISPAAVGIMGALPGRGQIRAETTGPAFDAASVKPHQETERRDRTRRIEPGRITCMDCTLGSFITMAYDLKLYQISGPDWIVSLRDPVTYDLMATAGKAVSVPEVKRMLATLLAERFHLAFHRETRELPTFLLVAAKGGPKFNTPGDGGENTIRPDGEGGLTFANMTMDNLAEWFTRLPSMERPVLDRTGLPGSFTFRANLFHLDKGSSPAELKTTMAGGDAADTLRATLPEQLGLKLEAQKAPVEILVVDHAEKVPTQN